jgi:hypothetical protein
VRPHMGDAMATSRRQQHKRSPPAACGNRLSTCGKAGGDGMVEAGPGATCDCFRLCAGDPCVGLVPTPWGSSQDIAGLHPAWRCAQSSPERRRAGAGRVAAARASA